MSVLAALDRYYGRMAARGEAEAPGTSRSYVDYALVLSAQGEPLEVIDRRDLTGKKPKRVKYEVPAEVKRTSAPVPNRLWDKTAYALGRTAGEGRRTAQEHAAFKALHRDLLAGTADAGLLALARFLEAWEPARFDEAPFRPEMLDANVVFRLADDRGLLHERPAARALLAGAGGGDEAEDEGAACLVTGRRGRVSRLHPTIKGVEGAQSSGASLVSFNLDAFASHGKAQGDNAPTSEGAAFRYGAALNRMLDRGSRNRLARPVGDATVVFWADTSEELEPAEAEAAAVAAEAVFARYADPPYDAGGDDDLQEAKLLREALDQVAAGRPVAALDPGVFAETRFHVLGLAPNAARLSVRYWLTDSFEAFARRLAHHHADLRIEPTPHRWGKPPSVRRLLTRTVALLDDPKNIPPLLAGEVMRAVLGGGRYPRSLLAAVLGRLRAGDDPGGGWHAAVVRACLARDARLRRREAADREAADAPALDPAAPSPAAPEGAAPDDRPTLDAAKEPPVSLDREETSPAYLLGRLFAALETAQRLALPGLNATIRDKYFGAAAATPALVFPLLMKGVQNHLGKLRKDGKGGWVERDIGEIVDRLGAAFPRSLALEGQGRFAIGYYHQRQAGFAKAPKAEAALLTADTPTPAEADADDD